VAKDACVGSFISVTKLEQLVTDELNRFLEAYLDRDEFAQKIALCENMQNQKDRLQSDLVRYEKKVEAYTKGIRGLYTDRVKGILSECDYAALAKELATERDRFKQLIADERVRLSELEEKTAAGSHRCERIEQYTHLVHLTREIVETLIDFIAVGKRIPGTREVPIEIHWNF
jgi:hypothetical protein